MSDDSSESIGLSGISGPSQSPPTAPDERTKAEISEAEKARKRTPTDKLDALSERVFRDLYTKRDQLEEQNNRLQAELSRIRPNYERLDEAFGNAIANNLISTSFMALGGVLVSAASHFPAYRDPILYFGLAAFVPGFVLSVVQTARGASARKRH